MEANTFVLSYQVWRQLRHHPDFVDRFKYTSSQSISTEMLGAAAGAAPSLDPAATGEGADDVDSSAGDVSRSTAK